MAHMAEQHGWRIVAPLYPLAPAHDVAGTTGFALSFYKDFLARQAGAPFLMAGDSAGAGLTAATVIAVRDAGLTLPAKLILICPWLNADPSHPDQPQIEKRDAILTIPGIRDAGRLYAGAFIGETVIYRNGCFQACPKNMRAWCNACCGH
jgi:acetyl esterase/lipase